MKRAKVFIHRIRIDQGGEKHTFQIVLPVTARRIVGIELSQRTDPQIGSDPPRDDRGDQSDDGDPHDPRG